MESKAKLRYLRMSPQKVRLVVDLIRDKNVGEALEILEFINKAAARPVSKLIKSAVANASQNESIDVDTLYVKNIYVDAGPTLKRIMFRAMGRANRILKRTSHISVVLDER
jgi:large subunit ribosomal protein L22